MLLLLLLLCLIGVAHLPDPMLIYGVEELKAAKQPGKPQRCHSPLMPKLVDVVQEVEQVPLIGRLVGWLLQSAC